MESTATFTNIINFGHVTSCECVNIYMHELVSNYHIELNIGN